MWLGKQQRRSGPAGEGKVGKVTIGGDEVAVMLDGERRGLEVYAPGGYRWTPRAEQRVLVIQGQGEIPCVVGVRQGEQPPEQVNIEAGQGMLALGAAETALSGEAVRLEGSAIRLNGQVYVGGETLEALITRIAAGLIAARG